MRRDYRVLFVLSIVLVGYFFIGSLTSMFEYYSVKDLEKSISTMRYTVVSIEQFNTFIEDKEISIPTYNVERDYLTARMDERAKTKYGIVSSGEIFLGNVSKLIEEGVLSNEVILNRIESDIKAFQKSPRNLSITKFILGLIFSVVIFRGYKKEKDLEHLILSQVVKSTQSNKEELQANELSEVKMADIKGHDEIKADLEFLIKFIKNPGRYEKVGAKAPKGVMLFGPPGTGKTMIAKAIANEVGIPFIAVGGSDFIEKYVGVGAKRVREVFAEASKHEKAIIYIDEIDAIGKKRTDGDNEERSSTLNALLMEMDGFKGSQNILVIASTNRIDVLDDALLRPGRFDKHIAVNPPDYRGRLDILRLYANNKKLEKDVKLEQIASITRGFSGAELSNLLNEAAMLTAFREKEKTSLQEIDDAYYKIVTKGDKKQSFERTSSDTEITAWHEAGHTVVSWLLAKQKVNKVTIIPSTSGAGGITLMEPKDCDYLSKEDLENLVKVCYGGRAAEYILLKDENKVTTGASNDIEKATNIILSMLSTYGMSSKFGLVNIAKIEGLKSESLLLEAKELSNKLYQSTIEFLQCHYNLLEDLSQRLIKDESLNEIEIEAIIEKHLESEKVGNIILPSFQKESKNIGLTENQGA